MNVDKLKFLLLKRQICYKFFLDEFVIEVNRAPLCLEFLTNFFNVSVVERFIAFLLVQFPICELISPSQSSKFTDNSKVHNIIRAAFNKQSHPHFQHRTCFRILNHASKAYKYPK